MEEIYTRLEVENENDTDDINETSEIQMFFTHQTIFLSGCTGFLGKVFVEKLLRSCPDIRRLYVLVRPKKLSIDDRMKQYFDNVIFDRLKKENRNFRAKVSIIEGDLSKANLGLSEKDRTTLVEETTLMYHNASNVKFDQEISSAIRVNVMGTKYMLDLAKRCKNLLAFVYISTAYSHCYKQHIEEKFYSPPGDTKMMMNIMTARNTNSTGSKDEELKRILGQWPNAYVFTKATAEGLVEENAKEVPFSCIVFRPSMVMSTYLEPIRGWCGNINGPVGVFIGNGIGFIHAAYKATLPVDYVPADMCANAMIATTWDAVINKKFTKEGIVYNYGSSTLNRISVKEFQMKGFSRGCDLPSVHMMGPYYTTFTQCIFNYWLIHLSVHLFTSLFADIILLSRGEKTQALSYWLLLTKNMSTLLYFGTGNWRIHVHRMHSVWNRMNRRDSKLFFCDLQKLDWNEYLYAYWAGLRVYVLKDPMSTLPAALRKYHRLTLIHHIFYYSVRILILYFVGIRLFNIINTLY